MAVKRVLYFSSTARTLYVSGRGGLQREAEFAPGPDGAAEFGAFIRSHGASHYYIVADLPGEEFHEEQIPFLRGGDRRAVIERRLVQRFRDSRVAAAFSLGVIAGERREERLLFASFADTEQFSPWLDAIADAGARFAGVYSVPLGAPALARALGSRAAHVLLVTVTGAGIRQCLVEGGKLRFARLEPVAGDAPQALAERIRDETTRLVAYLTTLRALPRGGPALPVLVVAPARARAACEQVLRSDERLVFRTVDIAEAARAARLPRSAEPVTAERLLLELILKRPGAEQYVRREERRGFLLWRLQRALLAACAAGFAACALVAGARALDAMDLRKEAADRRTEARRAEDSYQRITAGFPVAQTTTDNLKTTVNEFRAITARTSSPEIALGQIALVFDRFPRFVLDGIAWSAGDAASSSPQDGAKAAKPAATTALHETVQISGRVTAIQRSDYRAIATQVQGFVAELNALPGFRVVKTQMPFDVSPDGTLSSDLVTSEGEDTARFTLVATRVLK